MASAKAGRPAASDDSAAARACSARRATTPAASTWPTNAPGRAGAGARSTVLRRPWRWRRRCWPRAAAAAAPSQPRCTTRPTTRDIVGQVHEATAAEVAAALRAPLELPPRWAGHVAGRPRRAPGARRRPLQDRHAGLMRPARARGRQDLRQRRGRGARGGGFSALLRAQVRRDFDNATHRPLGPVVCISPWNFPLAIFTGQVAAALAAGNVVLAKPAEQTPLVAADAVRVLHAAGVPRGALQLLPGRGETVGAALVADARVQGVMFTGSTEVARLLQRAAGRRARCRRPAGAADRRDRRTERDAGRLVGAGRAGGGRRAGLGLRQRRPALLGAARAVRAGRGRRPPARDARRRDARAARRRPGTLATDVGPGDRRRGAGPDRAPHRRDARQRPPCAAAGAVDGEALAHGEALRAADADRDRPHRPSCSARCSARCCTCCATGATTSTRVLAPSTPPATA